MNELTCLKIYFYLENDVIEFLYDINDDKVWIDKKNLLMLSKMNNIVLSRSISKITNDDLIDPKINTKLYKKTNYKPSYLYDNKVIKNIINNDSLYEDIIKCQKNSISIYKKKILGKIYLKDGLLYLNDLLVNEKNIFFSKDDIIKFLSLDKNTYLEDDSYSLEELFDIAFKTETKKAREFRNWAYNILSKCLIDGYYINNEKCFNNKKKIISITNIADNLINKDYLNDEEKYLYYKSVIKYNDDLYDSSIFINDLIHHAKEKIIIISKYLNDKIFKLLDNINVKIIIYTSKASLITKIGMMQFKKRNDLTYLDNYNNDKTYIIIDNTIYYFDVNLTNIFKENSICKLINMKYQEFLESII